MATYTRTMTLTLTARNDKMADEAFETLEADLQSNIAYGLDLPASVKNVDATLQHDMRRV